MPTTGPSQPLAGITVVDLSRVLAGPFSTMILAQLGARVIKVEMPGSGDDARAFGPFSNGKSLYFSAINCNKESIALNLKADEDRAVFDRLVARADILVENYRPGTMEKLGYGWEDLHRRFPRLIYGAISGFGDTGPRSAQAAYDMVVQGLGGIMSVTGQPDGAPARVGVSIGDITAGLYLAIGVNAALYRRTLTGIGSKLDIAMLDCQVAIMEDAITVCAKTGEIPGPLGTRHPTVAPFQAYAAEDGSIIVAAGNDHLFALAAQVLGRPELAGDPRFSTNELRHRNIDALEAEIQGVLRTRPIAYWLDAFGAKGVPCAPLNDVAQMMAEPQVQARNMVVSVADPVAGELKVAGNPIKVVGVPEAAAYRPAPELDADRAALLAEFTGSQR